MFVLTFYSNIWTWNIQIYQNPLNPNYLFGSKILKILRFTHLQNPLDANDCLQTVDNVLLAKSLAIKAEQFHEV